MAVRSKLARIGVTSAVLLAGAGSAAMLSVWSTDTDWIEIALLTILACATTQLKLKLPGAPRPVSLVILPVAAAIGYQEPIGVLAVAAIAFLFERLIERESRYMQQAILEVPTIAVASLAAAWLFRFAFGELGFGDIVALSFAVCAYFVVATAVSALAQGVTGPDSAWSVWKDGFFWTAPVYLLAPGAVMTARIIVHSGNVFEVISVLGVAVVVGVYLTIYLSRLHDAGRSADAVGGAQRQAIETLADAINLRDGGSGLQRKRVKRHARMLAERLGCPEDNIQTLEMAAVWHDVGKVAIPDHILRKPARLTPHEFSSVARHTTAGAQIASKANLPEEVSQIIRSHHEHWDGTGYPSGIAGQSIPQLARILAVADCFSALLSDRPYREAMTIDQAIKVVREERGKAFDPDVVDAFVALVPEMRKPLAEELRAERGSSAHDAAAIENILQPAGSELSGKAQSDSARHRVLQRLALVPEQLTAFYEILENLGADLNFSKSTKECLRIMQRAVPYDKAGVFVVDRGAFVLLQGEGWPDHCVARLALPTEHGVAAQAAATRLPVVADAPPCELIDGRVPRYLDDLRSSLVMPLLVAERVVGVLVLGARETGRFSTQHSDFLSLITPKLASTVLSSRALQKVYREAETDEITSLPNARAAFRKLDAELKRAERGHQTVAVFYLDLDGLKPVNDSYGHAAGDKLLLDIGRNLRGSLRQYDFVGRVGGDEFMVIVPGIAKDGLEAKVQSLKKTITSRPVMVTEGVHLRPKISIGAALYPVDATDSEELIYLADRRMYRDKSSVAPKSELESVASGGSGP